MKRKIITGSKYYQTHGEGLYEADIPICLSLTIGRSSRES
jgi:hypothetical protein